VGVAVFCIPCHHSPIIIIINHLALCLVAAADSLPLISAASALHQFVKYRHALVLALYCVSVIPAEFIDLRY